MKSPFSSIVPGYHSNDECRDRIEQIPGHQRDVIGQSVLGRPIYGYSWTLPTPAESFPASATERGGANPPSLPPGAETPPTVLLVSLVHPMEWIAREVHIHLLETLLGQPSLLPPGTRILSVVDANPDGTHQVESALRAGKAAWVRGNHRGIDLNRNFPVGFQTRPRWIDFWPMWRPGPAALSEPESRALYDWARSFPLSVSLSLHSFGRWIFYPPSAHRRKTPDAERHESIARRCLARTPAPGYRQRQLGRYALWFRAHGIEIDSLAEEAGSLSYLVELSWGGFGRWGLRRLADPFFTFNPPHPEREIDRIEPTLVTLLQESIQGPESARRDTRARD